MLSSLSLCAMALRRVNLLDFMYDKITEHVGYLGDDGFNSSSLEEMRRSIFILGFQLHSGLY
jgi:hypothetical protein